jgi:pyruvate ferredoxin oxidoreductase gamma subunit
MFPSTPEMNQPAKAEEGPGSGARRFVKKGKPMVEIRIHGRGGQGNVIAAYLLATAAFLDGQFSQAFPSFGAERRGAPITAFVRMDSHVIRRRSQVTSPLFLILQDDGLFRIPETMAGLLPGGAVLVNSSRTPEELRQWTREDGLSLGDSVRLVSIAATRLAVEEIGKPIPNTVLLSAFVALTGLLSRESLTKALEGRFSGPLLDGNLKLAGKAMNLVQTDQWKEVVLAGSH